jgi:hypothetical protein
METKMEKVERFVIVRNNPMTNDMEYWCDGAWEFRESILTQTQNWSVINVTLWMTRDLAEHAARAVQAKTPAYTSLGIVPIQITAVVGDVLPVTVPSHHTVD